MSLKKTKQCKQAQVSSVDVEPTPETPVPSAEAMEANAPPHASQIHGSNFSWAAAKSSLLSISQVWTVALFLSYFIQLINVYLIK